MNQSFNVKAKLKDKLDNTDDEEMNWSTRGYMVHEGAQSSKVKSNW